MAAITICSDFGAPQNKVCHCCHCFPIYEVMRPDSMVFVSWMLSFFFPMIIKVIFLSIVSSLSDNFRTTVNNKITWKIITQLKKIGLKFTSKYLTKEQNLASSIYLFIFSFSHWWSSLYVLDISQNIYISSPNLADPFILFYPFFLHLFLLVSG